MTVVNFIGSNNWDNFKEWLRKYYAQDIGAVTAANVVIDQARHYITPGVKLERAFRLVDILRNDAWEKVEAVLDVYRDLIDDNADEENFLPLHNWREPWKDDMP